MTKLASFGTTLGVATLFAGAAIAQDISGFGDGVEGSYRVGQCPDVVVLTVPYCTDECGQRGDLEAERRAAAQLAVDKADIDNDGVTYAFVQAGASHRDTDEHNIALTQGRARDTMGLVQRFGALVQGAKMVFGERFARGYENDNFEDDRYGQALLTDDPSNIIELSDGRYAPRPGLRVIDYRGPACSQ